MAVVYVEGFDAYNGTDNVTATAVGLATRWSITGPSGLAAGRFGGQALELLVGGSSIRYVVGALPASYPTGTLGFAMRQTSAFTSSSSVGKLISMNEQINIYPNNDGSLSVRRSTTVLGTTAPGLIAIGAWNYVELEYVISTTVGMFNLYLNGSLVLSASGVNTQALGTDTTTSITMNSNSTAAVNGAGYLIDDLYLTDTPARLGEQRVVTVVPTSDGTPSQWAASGGAVAPFTMVDEVLCDGDTTYIFDGTVGDRAVFNMASTGATPLSVSAVQIGTFTRKTDTGTRAIQLQYVDSGGTAYDSASQTLGTTYGRQVSILENNPATATAWTPAEANALKTGVKVSV